MAKHGEIKSDLTMPAGQSVRRNAADDGFEAFTPGSGGAGDVVGPAVAYDSNFAAFDSISGKLLKDSGASAASFAAALGGDDNYVTDAEKVVIGNTSGTNSGDSAGHSGLEPANANIQAHVTAAHAPAGAQANADITKAEIEAKLTGELSSHSHGDVGTHAALKTGVHGLLNSVRIRPQVTPVAESTGAVTVHIADMLLGIVTGNPSAARAYTLDTGANCDAGMTIGVDEAFDWVLINLATTAAYIITLTASAGHTIVGSTKVPSNSTTTGGLWGTSSALWRTRKTAADTFVTYRIG